MKRTHDVDKQEEQQQQENKKQRTLLEEAIDATVDDILRLEYEQEAATNNVIAPEEEKYVLSETQQRALDAVERGENVFITGSAGTGKSFLIERIKESLTKAGRVFYVTATTGAAAYNIGGMTIHSFAGIGLGDKEISYHLKTIKDRKNAEKVERWNAVETLIIDEISMLAPAYLEKINTVAKTLRNRKTVAFGGIQIILIGDFTQLPPVPPKVDPNQKVLAKLDNQYVFQIPTWRELALTMVKLETNFRQKDDVAFNEFLGEIRLGNMTTKEEAIARSRDINRNKATLKAPDGVTKLFSYRNDVLRFNNEELAKIDAPSFFYEAEIYEAPESYASTKPSTNGNNNNNKSKSETSYPVETRIELKVGASVLLCFNMNRDEGLFNGSRGVIVRFADFTKKKEKDDKKSGGTGGDVPDKEEPQIFPVVQFDNGVRRIIRPHTWSQYERKKLVKSFTQIPLVLSYAMTIHRSQGLTLDAVLVDMNVFACGQLYVALSRVRRLDALYVTNSHIKQQVLADKAVIAFYEKHHLI